MNKSIYDKALKELTWLLHDEFDDNPKRSRLSVSERLNMFKRVKDVLEQAQKQEKLLELYKEFFDKLNIQLRNTFDIDYIYPHEFIIGYDIKSEDKELVKLFKQIKELLE